MIVKILFPVLVSILISCGTHKHQNEDGCIPNFQYTAYSKDFELFAEADAFIAGKTSNVLSHFSTLPDFKALEKGAITIILAVDGKEVRQVLEKPTRKGIYSFDITPQTTGKGTLKFEISNDKGNFVVDVSGVTVYKTAEEAEDTASKIVIPQTNTAVFTKEQSWKTDFSTGFPADEPFGQIIKTTALVSALQENEMIVSAKTNGIVIFGASNIIEGIEVLNGQALFSISGSNFADNSFSVKYAESQSNFEKAQSDYNRATELAKDKIVTEKDLLSAKNQYENAKAVFDNLRKNFNATGQTITSPQAGFIKQVFVTNGEYVVAGQPIVVVSQNKSLVLSAEVPAKYAPVLANIKTANIRTINDNRSYTLDELKGKVLSYGKAANNDNYLIPVTLQVVNNGKFISGSFVEVYLKTFTDNVALAVPNTALLEEQGSYFVWVQVTPELFEKREVFVGGSDGINTEIKKGINSKERIVTRGAMLIKLAQATGNLDAHSGHVH